MNNQAKTFQCKLTGDGKLRMVTNGGAECWWGCLDACGLVPIEDAVDKIQLVAFLGSVCIRIGHYGHAGCGAINAFEKFLRENVATLTVGVVGVQRIASDFGNIWSTLLADVKHVASSDRLFQRTTEAGQFDISTCMLFLSDPK